MLLNRPLPVNGNESRPLLLLPVLFLPTLEVDTSKLPFPDYSLAGVLFFRTHSADGCPTIQVTCVK